MGIITDPNAPIDPETGQPMEPSIASNIDGDSGKVPTDIEDQDGDSTEV